ncbi:hypothetical protein PRZ48_004598 [Zasmidium cellare]|uniref:FAD-binding PCMH-type domain-containing protein n=1 Tax=Zasmidium cellare TaxID=395010 RepID=A0ABR0ERF3_ZASCE|nr:hypothetical protein PRZ48_004598 [Zasmidium cellare]
MHSFFFTSATLLLGVASGAVLNKKADISTVPASAWGDLNNTVQGRLHAEFPMGAFCFAQYEGALNPHIDLAQCALLEANQQDTKFMASYAQGYSYSTWPMCIAKNESCNTQGHILPNPLNPLIGNCQQGSIPNYYIYAEHDGDIQAGLKFAKKYNIPLVIKASGHDYKGRSAGQGALKIWTANYKFAMQYSQNFQPAGAPQGMGPAITYNAGHSMEEVLNFADQNGGAVQAATAMSVRPAGGFLQGGGHSPLSVSYGLAVDNALEIRGLLPDGTPFIANRQQNSDLFFALRGGGPGTFGVVTQSANQLLQVLIANAEQWAKDGWGGYAFPSLTTNHTSFVVLTTPKLTLAQAQKSIAPLADFIATLPQSNVAANILLTYPSYLPVWNETSTIADNLQGGGVSLSSRLVPVDNFRGAQNQQSLFNAIAPIMNAFGPLATKPLFMCFTTPYGYDGGDDAKTSSVTPAWRDSLWHIIALDEWDPNEDEATIEAEFKKTHDVIQPLINITPGSGAYQNEADTFETDPIGAYWGQDNYNKLLSIKKKYDPSNVLTCWQCVGWNQADSRYSCYPDA